MNLSATAVFFWEHQMTPSPPPTLPPGVHKGTRHRKGQGELRVHSLIAVHNLGADMLCSQPVTCYTCLSCLVDTIDPATAALPRNVPSPVLLEA